MKEVSRIIIFKYAKSQLITCVTGGARENASTGRLRTMNIERRLSAAVG